MKKNKLYLFTCWRKNVTIKMMTMTIMMIIQFIIIYVLFQQLQGQLQTQHSVDTSNYIMDKHNIKSKTN
jgi:hypothetical protein